MVDGLRKLHGDTPLPELLKRPGRGFVPNADVKEAIRSVKAEISSMTSRLNRLERKVELMEAS
jgi:hypothetical protein